MKVIYRFSKNEDPHQQWTKEDDMPTSPIGLDFIEIGDASDRAFTGVYSMWNPSQRAFIIEARFEGAMDLGKILTSEQGWKLDKA